MPDRCGASEARWRHAGPVRRALATPGNQSDLVIAVVLVALVAVAIATG